MPLVTAHAQALPWTIEMRQVREPTPNGDCGPIELTVRDATGKTPMTPDGKQIDWQDFDIILTHGAGPLKLIRNGRFLCATAPGATGVVTATYPESTYLTGAKNKGRTGKLLIPGATATATLTVRSAGSSMHGPPTEPPPAISPAPPMAAPAAAVGTTVPELGPSPVVSATVVNPAAPVPAIGTPLPAPRPQPATATIAPTLRLAGFTAAGLYSAPPSPPSLRLVGFAGDGGFSTSTAPLIRLGGFAGDGGYTASPPSPRIRTVGFAGEGLNPAP